MTTTPLPGEFLQQIREQRSSESNFAALHQTLTAAIATAEKNNDTALAAGLKEVEEKYAGEYQKAKEAGGSAWPEFENFVTHLERTLTAAKTSEA